MTAASIKSGTGVTRFNVISATGGSPTDGNTTPYASSSINSGTVYNSSTSANGIQYREGSGKFFTNTTGAQYGTRWALTSNENLSASDTLVFVHMASSSANPKLGTLSSTVGAGIFLNSSDVGTEERAYTCLGNGDLGDDYTPMVVDPSRASDTFVDKGPFDTTDVSDIGVCYQHTGSGPLMRCSSAGKLTPVVIIGGTGVDAPADFTVVSDHFYDLVTLLHKEPVTGTHICLFRWDIGDGGTNAVEVTISGQTFVYGRRVDHSTPIAGHHINDNTFGHTCNLGASDVVSISNCIFTSATPIKFRIEGNASATVTYTSCTITNAGDLVINDGYTFSSCSFNECDELVCSQPTLTSCTFNDAAGSAFKTNSTNSLTNCTSLTFNDNATAIEVDVAGSCAIDITNHTFSGNTTDIKYNGTGTLTISGTSAQEAALTTSAPSGTISWNTPTDTFTINASESGSLIQIFTTNTQTVLDSTTGSSLAFAHSEQTVDYVVQKAGFLPQRVTGVSLSGSTSVTITLVEDPVYDSSHVLTFTTDYSYNTTTRVMTIVAAQQGRDLYSAMIDDFISESSLFNKPFPLLAIGPDRIDFTSDGTTAATIDSGDVQFWRGAGMEWEHATTGNPTHKYCAIKGTGTNASGTKGYYQQVDGASPTALTLVSNNIDQVIQYYSDPNGDGSTADGYDYSGHLVVKLFNDGYYQASSDILDAYGISAIESFEYTVPMLMVSTGLGTGTRSITITVTDNTPAGVEEQTGYTFDYKIEGGASDSPEDLLRQWIYDVYTDPTASTYATKVNFNWPDPILETGGNYETKRGYVYGQDTTTTYSGFYVEEGTGYHPDFLRQQANDGTYYVTPVTAQINVSGMSDDSTAGDTRLQIWNETGRTASAWQATTAYSDGDKALRSTGVGTENTAGLYFVVTAAGTSGGTEPTWSTTPGTTTADGSVTWTCYKVLYHDADPAGTSYSDTYNDTEEFNNGDTAGYRFADMNAGSTHKIDSGTVAVSSSGFTIVVSPTADSVFATNSVDGSAVTQFTADFTNDEIDLSADSDFIAAQAYAFYCYTLTTSNGMWNFWGGVNATSGNYEIQTSILNLYFDNTTTGSVKQTDSARIYRDDGAYPVKDPTTSGYGVQVNWANQVFSVNTGGSGLTAGESALLANISPIKAKTDSLTFTQSGHVDANIKRVADTTITGSGTSVDPWGP